MRAGCQKASSLCFFVTGAIFFGHLGILSAEEKSQKFSNQDLRDSVHSFLEQAHKRELAKDRYWLLLMHYRKSVWGGYKSEADGRDFFLSPQGKYDPASELDATIEAFFLPSQENADSEHPQCRFPARYAWLKRELGFVPEKLPEQPCPEFEKWRQGLAAQSVAVVFAAAYLNSSSSMYGHTFFKLGSNVQSQAQPLLGYAVNFGAVTNDQTSLRSVVLGLTGGYPGRFTTLPFYMKVQEYSHMESRDLWEYSLNLDREATDRLVMHLWELGATYFDYYFFKENCSYQLLPVLEVADPSFHLTERFHFRAIPVDTIRALDRSGGIVSEVHYRPSHVSQALHKGSYLTFREGQLARDLVKQGTDSLFLNLEGFPKERQALILDTALDYFRYRWGFGQIETQEVKNTERRLLVTRGRLGIQSPGLAEVTRPPSPTSGHKTARGGFSFGFTRNSTFEELSLRAALHDLAADPAGYTLDSQLEMFHLRGRLENDSRRFFLEDFVLAEIVSLTPLSAWIRQPSWKIGTGLSRAKEFDCEAGGCLHYRLSAGAGFATQTHAMRGETHYLLGLTEAAAGGIFRDGYRLGLGAQAGILAALASHWRVHLEGSYLPYFLGDTRNRRSVKFTNVFNLTANQEFRLTFEKVNHYQEVNAGFNAYF